ncbi:MAG: hypothetical protein AVDCRST_MAG90-2583, partial [uncultured Microvirga sp.]
RQALRHLPVPAPDAARLRLPDRRPDHARGHLAQRDRRARARRNRRKALRDVRLRAGRACDRGLRAHHPHPDLPASARGPARRGLARRGDQYRELRRGTARAAGVALGRAEGARGRGAGRGFGHADDHRARAFPPLQADLRAEAAGRRPPSHRGRARSLGARGRARRPRTRWPGPERHRGRRRRRQRGGDRGRRHGRFEPRRHDAGADQSARAPPGLSAGYQPKRRAHHAAASLGALSGRRRGGAAGPVRRASGRAQEPRHPAAGRARAGLGARPQALDPGAHPRRRDDRGRLQARPDRDRLFRRGAGSPADALALAAGGLRVDRVADPDPARRADPGQRGGAHHGRDRPDRRLAVGRGCRASGHRGAGPDPDRRHGGHALPQQRRNGADDGPDRRQPRRQARTQPRPVPDGGGGRRGLRLPHPHRAPVQHAGHGAGRLPLRRLREARPSAVGHGRAGRSPGHR